MKRAGTKKINTHTGLENCSRGRHQHRKVEATRVSEFRYWHFCATVVKHRGHSGTTSLYLWPRANPPPPHPTTTHPSPHKITLFPLRSQKPGKRRSGGPRRTGNLKKGWRADFPKLSCRHCFPRGLLQCLCLQTDFSLRLGFESLFEVQFPDTSFSTFKI